MHNRRSCLLLLFLLVLLGGCHPGQKSEQEYPYLLAADIEGCTACKLVLWNIPDLTTVDTAASKNGHLLLKGKINHPGFYKIFYFCKNDNSIGGNIDVYLPADSVHIKVNKNDIRKEFYQVAHTGSYLRNTVVFSTSPKQKEWEQYLWMKDSLWHKFFVDKELVRAKFFQTIGAGNKALTEQWADSASSFEYRFTSYLAQAADLFVRQHPTSDVALFAMLDNRNALPSVGRFRRYYNAMPAQLQHSFYGQALDKQLAQGERRSRNGQRFMGSYIHKLAGKSPAGKAIDAASIFKRNKLTLVEFWASWCGPCRVELPKYYKLYKQYKGKGFDIIGVSLDNNYTNWVKAIAEDSLQIHHVSELKAAYGDDEKHFGITGIPYNMLVDSTSKIVDVDVLFPKLRKELQQSL